MPCQLRLEYRGASYSVMHRGDRREPIYPGRCRPHYAKRLTNVTSPAGSFDYTLGGTSAGSPLPKKILLPNTSYITNHYDSVARLLFTKLNNSSHTTLNKHEYIYNTGNQRTKHTRTDDSHLTFSYDSIGQLTIVRTTNSAGTILGLETKGYLYDAAWNLNRRTNNSSGSSQTFSVDVKNQLTSGAQMSNVTHDDNGNLTFGKTSSHTSEEYRYDDENRLVTWYFYDDKNGGDGSPTSSVDLRTDLVYDGLGRLRNRVEYDTDGSTWNVVSETRYSYDGMRVIQERNSGNTPTGKGSLLTIDTNSV